MSLHARLDGYMVRRIVKLFSKVQKSTFDAIWYADRVERVKIIPLLTYVLALICEIRESSSSCTLSGLASDCSMQTSEAQSSATWHIAVRRSGLRTSVYTASFEEAVVRPS